MVPSSKSTNEASLKGLSVESQISSSLDSKVSTQLSEIKGKIQLSTQLTESKGGMPSQENWEKASSVGISDFLICQTNLDLGTVAKCFFKNGK